MWIFFWHEMICFFYKYKICSYNKCLLEKKIKNFIKRIIKSKIYKKFDRKRN